MATAGTRTFPDIVMKRAIFTYAVAALLLPACALAHSEFDGAWKLDPPTLRISHGEHTVISLQNGVYRCDGCQAATISIKADGVDHDVVGDPDIDTVAADVINDHSIRTIDKKAGKVVSTSTDTVAADGQHLTISFTNEGARPRSGTYVMQRIGAAAPGQHPVAGTWRFDHHVKLNDATDVIVLKLVGDTITVGIGGTSESFTATLGGAAVPFAYRSGEGTTVSVQRVGPHSLRESFMRHGKVTLTRTVTILPDGRTMQMTVHNLHSGSVTTMLHDKL